MGRRALHLAAASGNVSGMSLLLQYPGIQIDPVSAGLETPLMRAIQFANRDCVLLLLQVGADPLNPRSVCGMSPLEMAQLTKNTDIIGLLEQRIA